MKRIIFILTIFICSCQLGDQIVQVKPIQRDVTESIYASIKIIPYETYYPQTSISGVIESINVKIGDQVKKGDVLFTIKAPNIQTRLDEANIALDLAEANYTGRNNLLTSIKIEITNAENKKRLDSVNLYRLQNLWAKKIGTKVDLDKAQLVYESSINSLDQLHQKYEQTKQDLASAYDRSHNRVISEKINMSEYTIRALSEGKVYDVYKDIGEVITPQERFAEIGSNDLYKIEMDVDEVDITQVNIGDTAVISLDAYPQNVFGAKVIKILPKKDETNLTYTLEGEFIDAPDRLFYGLSGEANIVIAKRQGVLTIPTTYLTSDQTVLTANGPRSVKIGIKNLEFAEIISGIDSSTVILKPEE
jgi:multidrug efflux pump subunit AcrA (membrane-fusion protein)